jgi:hypothetical protein
MMISVFRCMFHFRSLHRLAWPIRGIQRCSDCGETFPALVKIQVDKRFKKPRRKTRVTVIRIPEKKLK